MIIMVHSTYHPLDEDEVFKNLPPRKQCIYNEMVEFQKELRQHGLAGSLHRVLHAQQEKINPPMSIEVAQKEMATATTATSVIKSEMIHTSAGPVWYVLHPFSSKKNCQKYMKLKIVDAYKDELPAIPDHMFQRTKWEPNDPAESYSEYETDRSDYLSNDVEIQPETDSDEAAEFVDETLAVYNLENIKSGLAKIRNSFLMAAKGYKNIRHELSNLDPMEIPQIMVQVHMPQMNELSKPLQQLLTKTTGKTIVIKFIHQLLFKWRPNHP